METCVRDDYSIPPSTTCQRLLATKHSALTLRSTLISPALLYFVTVDFSDIRSRWSTLLHTLFNDDEPNQSRMVIFDHFGSVTLGPIQLKLECVIVTHPTPHAKYGGHRKRGRVGRHIEEVPLSRTFALSSVTRCTHSQPENRGFSLSAPINVFGGTFLWGSFYHRLKSPFYHAPKHFIIIFQWAD